MYLYGIKSHTMKAKLIITFILGLVFTIAKAQVVPDCSTLPLELLLQQGTFGTTSGLSFGDSAYVIPVINKSTDYYAYPCLRPEFLTPLPAGTTLSAASQGFTPFASAFMPGDTIPYSAFFTVTQPIPANYMVSIRFWGGNLAPANPDSCVFGTPVTVNLNPQGTTKIEEEEGLSVMVFPNPVSDFVTVQGIYNNSSYLKITDLTGRQVVNQALLQGSNIINTSWITPGVYVLTVTSKNKAVYTNKIVVR